MSFRNIAVLLLGAVSVGQAQQRAPADSVRLDSIRVDSLRRAAVGTDSARRIGAMQVTATFAPTRVLDAPQPVAVLGGAELRRAQGAAVGELLEQLPGVRSLSMTTGIGKPVIRGLTHNRIVTLDNGQRTETQQWGHDHSPNVETANAEQVEVIKGPASVLYGSDALGGVVNVIAPAMPSARGESPFLRGTLTTAYNTNVMGPDATIRLEAAREGLGARLALTGRSTGDMRAPTGPLRNTENRTGNVDAALGYAAATGKLSLRYARREERIEIFDDPVTVPGYTGYQRLTTDRGTLEAERWLSPALRLQTQLGVESNFRREFAASDASDITLGLLVNTATGFVHLHHDRLGPLAGGTIGVFAMDSRFEKRGLTSLIPNSRSRGLAVYALEHLERGRLRGTIGARWDVRDLSIEDDAELGLSADAQSRSAVTGSAGVSYRLTPVASLVASVGRGFRAPAAPDLYAYGFHEGTRAFERGNPNLGVETSLNTDLGLRVEAARVTGELSVFRNAIDDYIYLRPFGTGAAFDSLEVVQGNALLQGLEARAAWRALPWLTLQGAGDIVRGNNTTAEVPLTFVPPPRAQVGARFERQRLGAAVIRPSLSLQGEYNWRQTRVDPRDVAPPGYALWNLGAGGTLLLGSRVFIVDASLRNAFDTEFRSFMSRYKEFANGPGRALILRVTTEF
ncbi:MAG: TonB-dependent receptor [Gemmatimonadaceae bacterium]|nr:TonB-dependent receptor [Gemmatimonadaceae bacterium]